ncbi:MAG: HPr(Ser) kinase/phosphatase [Gammaproteobacteria bacterium]|nr:HPr(Ser) kinase/phosphatase [Gammaproteobacteria bacterium]MCW8909506.1 HPr(Ser) kinase/phosphatase [Gammaproteobacteria bacterium]MCW9004411.1 HPr(Ser) kinase/phosphatase [Gammaproteobacteria bacterium]MCW9055800.1 HPr(Ser) kinase/phosphatase [Gammaproteobacteria bacterium]
MKEGLTPRKLFEHLSTHIDLHWVAGTRDANRPMKKKIHWGNHATMIGHLNLIHPNSIQVIGETEWQYLEKLKKNSRQDTLDEIFIPRTSAIIISDGIDIPDDLIKYADNKRTPLLKSHLSSNDLIDSIRYYLSGLLADKIVLHGVLMEVMGTGVLITGESSVGKSELALELITRGHRLIADDAPEFTRIGPNILNGSCPEVLKDFMEVRGLGVLNIRAMYGENAIKQNKYLRLIIHMERMSIEDQQQLDRLYGNRTVRNILDVDIPQIMLPVASGRNLAVMVEAAVRNHILLEHGHDASEEFINRQSQFIK